MMSKKKLELYVHIPFCVRKCAYCDFLSFPGTPRMQKEYVRQLLKEIEIRSADAGGYEVCTVFIGGGTPSILPPEDIAAVMEAVKTQYQVADNAEVTIEANPGTVRMEGLECYKKAGVNRLSLGLQSADDMELKHLGRIHTFDEFLKTFQRARMAGFTNINVDLISAIPGQSFDSWKNTLKQTARLKPEHISAYSLIVEEGTPYYERYGEHVEMKSFDMSWEERKRLMALPDLPDEDTERGMYYLTRDYLASHGYERYEISNYARPGMECRHNTGYWTGTSYLGLGLGASSCFEGWRFHNITDIRRYIDAHLGEPNTRKSILRAGAHKQSVQDAMEEFMFLGLRLTCGVTAKEFTSRFGKSILDIYGTVISQLEEDGLMEHDKGRYRLTLRGLDLSNYAMSKFLLS